MIQAPMDVLKLFPVRKTKKQKQAFRESVISYLSGLGYPVKVEKGSMGCQNVVIGEAEKAKYLVTAHYDTPAGMILPNFLTPCNLAAYLVYQILLVIMLFAFAFVVSFCAALLTDSYAATALSAYVAYFGVLLLMLFGPANKNNANDNTSGVVTVLEMARTLPEGQRNKVCFVLFDLEEAGLVGSASYRKAHKTVTDKQIILNLDCVGDGDEIMIFPTNKLKKDAVVLDRIEKICGEFGPKSLRLHRRGFAMYPSDQKNFPLGVGIAAFKRNRLLGLYCDRIHTRRDTVLEQTNVNILRAALTTLISNDAVQ